MLLDSVLILAGFLLLIKGGDYLVQGAVNIARAAKLSPMVIGLTVVGFGTSMPELLVSSQAAWNGSPGIAIGNVVGSNIANIGLILGLSAIISPLVIGKKSLIMHLPIMVASSVVLAMVGMSGTIPRLTGLGFLCLLGVYTVMMVRDSRLHPDPNADEQLKDYPTWGIMRALIITLLSFGALILGANILVEGATNWAMRLGEWMGVAPKDMERIIGLTVVAVGTSLPELFASVMAAKRGQSEIALGNIVGSITFNVLCVIGVASTISPIDGSATGFELSYTALVGFALLLYLVSFSSRLITRLEGVSLLLCYALYLALIL